MHVHALYASHFDSLPRWIVVHPLMDVELQTSSQPRHEGGA